MPSKPPDYKYCQGRGRVLPTEILAPYELLNEGRLFLGCIDAAADSDFLKDHEAGAATGGGGSPYPRRHIHTYMCGDAFAGLASGDALRMLHAQKAGLAGWRAMSAGLQPAAHHWDGNTLAALPHGRGAAPAVNHGLCFGHIHLGVQGFC